MPVKVAKVGVYGEKTRALQRRLAFERTSQTFKTAFVYLYLGDRSNPEPALHDVGVRAFAEVPDRAYEAEPIEINIEPEKLSEQAADLSRFGIIDQMGNEHTFRVHVNSYEDLGRAIRVGDVLMLPFFERDEKHAFWEITDVDRNPEFEKYYSVIRANPLDDARETREIPLNNSNAGILQDAMEDMDLEFGEQVPFNGFDTDEVDVTDPNQNTDKTFDPRGDDLGDFMDDPSKTF